MSKDDLGAVLQGAQEYPEEDSEDLTDEEIASAIPSTGTDDIVAGIMVPGCSECGGKVRILSHDLRRRKPHLYWRATVECGQNHRTARLFEADWI